MLLLKLAIFQTAQAQARAIRLSLLIASQIRTRASIPPAIAPDAPYAAGRRARTTLSCDCGHLWHTFDTGGICPACLHRWTSTQCLKCGG